MSYPGGKNGSGVYQTLINLMPPHDRYIEPFLGMGGVMRNKRPAFQSIGIDSDVFVTAQWTGHTIPGLIVECGDGIRWLRKYSPRFTSRTLVYCDPPYLATKWPSKYRHKMTAKEHELLLEVLLRLNCMVMLSGFSNPLYERTLHAWRRFEFLAPTRGNTPANEVVWSNFPPPRELHDYRFLGQTFREREVIRRRIQRWKKRFSKMNELESYAMFAALEEVRGRARSSKMAMVPEESPKLARAAATAGSGEVRS